MVRNTLCCQRVDVRRWLLLFCNRCKKLIVKDRVRLIYELFLFCFFCPAYRKWFTCTIRGFVARQKPHSPKGRSKSRLQSTAWNKLKVTSLLFKSLSAILYKFSELGRPSSAIASILGYMLASPQSNWLHPCIAFIHSLGHSNLTFYCGWSIYRHPDIWQETFCDDLKKNETKTLRSMYWNRLNSQQ